MIPTLLAVLVIVFALPLNWYVAAGLWKLHRAQPERRGLRERGIVATALALIVTVFAGAFVNNSLPVPIIDVFWTQIITRSAILALAFPALYWLHLYR